MDVSKRCNAAGVFVTSGVGPNLGRDVFHVHAWVIGETGTDGEDAETEGAERRDQVSPLNGYESICCRVREDSREVLAGFMQTRGKLALKGRTVEERDEIVLQDASKSASEQTERRIEREAAHEAREEEIDEGLLEVGLRPDVGWQSGGGRRAGRAVFPLWNLPVLL